MQQHLSSTPPVFEPLATALTPEQRQALPRAIVVDLDGTLCLRTGRDPYDESLIGTDAVDPAVLAVIRAFHRDDALILFTSGRRERTRADSQLWLDRHLGGIPYRLFMRPDQDNRDDALIKFEIHRDHLHDRYAIIAVFDDRDRVVTMWRDIGLKCMQVAPGDF